MNLIKIKEILSDKLSCPDKHTKTIIELLDIVKHKGKRIKKSEMVEIIERDAKK